MARITIPAASIITPLGPYPTLPVAALGLDLTWQAAAVGADNNQFALGTGKYLILARNVHASIGYTVTFTSAPDVPFKRSGDITTYALGFGKALAFMVDLQGGWIQTDGMFYLAGSDVSVQFCILRLP